MTAALRSTDVTALVAADHVHDLIQEKSQLERDLTSARVRNATLRRELARLVDAPTVVGSHVVDGLLTLTLSTGAVIQRRPHVIDTSEEFGYSFRWVALEPLPDTPAAIVDEAFAGDDNLPAALYGMPASIGRTAERQQERQHHDATFRTLADLALRGLAVSAGDSQ